MANLAPSLLLMAILLFQYHFTVPNVSVPIRAFDSQSSPLTEQQQISPDHPQHFPSKSPFQSLPIIKPHQTPQTVPSSADHDQHQRNHRHRKRRHRRRLPVGMFSRLVAKFTGRTGKVAAAAGKADDVIVGAGSASKSVGRGPWFGRGAAAASRRQQYKSRPIDPPPFSPYSLPKDEVARARSKALTGANVALAAGGVAAGIWYFSGENTVLSIVLIIGAFLLLASLVLSLIIYLCLCRNHKKGYYAVNDGDLAAAFAKKLLFYLFC